jgi:uncharacterized protein YdeI (YjbR/CyaY-like superfamily)
VDLTSAIWIESAGQWSHWLATSHDDHTEIWLAIYKKATGKQTVTFDELLETALCWGWVDVMTKGLDDERYAIRFRRRRPGSNWSPTNRRIVCRLIDQGRMQPAGRATLPSDLVCD